MAAVLPFDQPRPSADASRSLGLALALGLHALAGIALLAYEPTRSALRAAAPLMVDLIAPPRAEPPKPPPPQELPKPRPVVKRTERPLEPPPILTAPAEATSPAIVAPPPPAPLAPVPIVPVAAAKPAPAAPITPPVFDADYLLNPAPAYPALSRRMGEQGRVVLRVLVSAAGAAQEVQVRSSSGHPRLDEAARETVRAWKFVPARRGDQAVAAWVLIPISFRLEG